MVGVAAPEEVAAVVKAHRDAFAAREVRERRGTAALPFEDEARGVGAESTSDAGRLRERGAEEGAEDLVARIWWETPQD